MRAYEFIFESPRKKKEPEIVKTPADHAYEQLMSLKERGIGKHPANSYQLFMPRPHPVAKSRYDKHLDNISNSYRYEKDGDEYTHNISKEREEWANKSPDSGLTSGLEKDINEGAPVIAARNTVPPGNNKPYNTVLWTSTAKRLNNGTYTSDWVRWVASGQPNWMNETGYLYKVNANICVCEIDNDYQAEDIYDLFNQMGRGATRLYDREASYRSMNSDFPWDQVAKHFDCVHHYDYGHGNEFTYGWDCESSGWFNPDALTLVGEVKINQNGISPFENDWD